MEQNHLHLGRLSRKNIFGPMKTNPQFVTDKAGNRVSVLLPIKVYEQRLAELEELEDIRLYDAVKAKNEPTISLEEYKKRMTA